MYEQFKTDSLERGDVTAAALVTLLTSYKFILSVGIWTDMLFILNLLSKFFQTSHVTYCELRKLLKSMKEGFTRLYLTRDLFLGGPCYNELVAEADSRGSNVVSEGTQVQVLTDAQRSQKWVEDKAEVCVEYTCDKTNPHHLR